MKPPTVTKNDLIFTNHATKRIEERNIPFPTVLAVINNGTGRFQHNVLRKTLMGYTAILYGNMVLSVFEQGGRL